MTSPVVTSATSFDFDGHTIAYSVHERGGDGRLIGHVAKSDVRPGMWVYLGVTETRGTWTLAGWTRAEALRSLMSWWSPSAPWVSIETADYNPNLFKASPVQAYRCGCCGDDVMDTGPVCGDCRAADCQETTDAGGERGYTNCNRPDDDNETDTPQGVPRGT